MAFAHKLGRAAIALAAIAATAVLLFYGDGMQPRWLLMWFAPLPVLLFALRRPAWQAGLAAAVAWMAGWLNLWSYLRALNLPPIVWFLACGTSAVAFTVGVLLFRALARRGALWCAWLALPSLWIAFEFVRNLLWPHGSGGCIAYSQLNFLPFLQTASLAGPWGMGFVLMLFPAGLALGLHPRKSSRRQSLRVMVATLGILAVLLIFGAVRLSIPQPGPEVRVGLIASDANGGAQVEQPGPPAEHLFESYAQKARQLIAQGAQVVVMPEDMAVVPDSNLAATDAIFQPIADQTGAVLVVGMAHASASVTHNESRIYMPGVAARSYDKEHLLPPWETAHFTPGAALTRFSPPTPALGRIWAVAICKDLDFTNPARTYGKAHTGLLLAPAWDFRIDSFWHGHIAVMRAVEDGFSLARAARRGFLTVADNRGRIVAENPSNAAPFATLLATVPAGHSPTLFVLLGDWFGWCAIATLIFVLVQLARRRGRLMPVNVGEYSEV